MSSLIYKVKHFVLQLLLVLSFTAIASTNAFARPSLVNLNLYLGNMDAAETSGVLEDSSSPVAIGFASSQRLRHYPYLALDMELWDLASEYRNTLQAPLFVSINDDMELITQGITFGARLLTPYDAPYHFYLSGGFGYFSSNLRVFANLLGVPGYYEDDSREFAPYLGAGFTVNLGYRQTLEMFYRRWDIEGDFSRFDIPNTDIGGEAVGIGFGMYW
jgi:hypothetical protein